MSLADQEIIELHELCSALADDRLTAEQGRRLSGLLKQSADARRIYFQAVLLSTSLAEHAGGMQTGEAAPPARHQRPASWRGLTLALAATLALGFFIRVHFQEPPAATIAHEDPAEGELQTGVLVARVTGAKNCVWQGGSQPQPGDVLHRGQQLALKAGTAEITFDCGAQIVLDAPAALDVASAWEAVLRRGGLKATVQPQAAGFRVRHASVEVLDLGTEFSMVADADGDAEVHVLKGSVEVSPTGNGGATPAVLRENEFRQFGKSRKSRHNDFAKRHARLAQTALFDRWKKPVHFCHWSFDELSGGTVMAEAAGLPGMGNAQAEPGRGSPSLTEGRWQKALHLDGNSAMTAAMPGIAKAAPRTVAFWVRVPEDARLSNAQAMIAWQMHSKKLGSRALEIGWNRNPNQGPLGALRTELGKNYAVGATPLRDGRWHHIAVLFVPIATEDGPLQITQYVDGRLEGTTLRLIKNKHGTADAPPPEVIWLGRTPGKHSKSHFFRGDMDELFVTDRALSPPEIERLMMQNLPPRVEVAAAGTSTAEQTGILAAITP